MKASIVVFLAIISLSAHGQLKVLDSVKIQNVEHLSIDKSGDLYVGDIQGNIVKFSSDLKELQRFSPARKGGITTLDAWNPLRVFVGYGDIQEYVFLDRFLVNENRFSLRDLSSYIGVCAPSLDNNVWLVDYADFSLKKYNIVFNQIEINRSFDLVLKQNDYSITHIREYQNLLFICDSESGILVFDNLANYLYTIETEDVTSLAFWKNELSYITKYRLVSRNIYEGEERSIFLPIKTKLALKSEKYYFFYKEKWLFKAEK